MSTEQSKDDESSGITLYESLYKHLYVKDGARKTRLPPGHIPWLPINSVLYGGKDKLTVDDIKKLYGISKTEYSKALRNFKSVPDVCYWIVFTQSENDGKTILAMEDEIYNLKVKAKAYKDAYEKIYTEYLELADRLRKYEKVELK